MEGACALLRDYLTKFHLAPQFDADDFKHFFMPKEEVIYSYVIEVRCVICTSNLSWRTVGLRTLRER